MAYKQFTPDVLSSADVNTYLMKQSVMAFANATARTNSLGATPTEGMVTYLQDVDELEVYNGTSWLRLVVTADDDSLSVAGDLTVDTTTFKVDATNNRVGIGTASPSLFTHIYAGASGNSYNAYTTHVRIENNGQTGISMHTPTANDAAIGHATPLDGASSAIIFDGPNRALRFATVNGTTRMTINSAGLVTMPYQPAFQAFGPVAAATSGTNPVRLTNVHVNRGSVYNTSTGFFTAPVAGCYMFHWSFLAGPTNDVYRFYLRKNGVRYDEGLQYRADTSATGSEYNTNAARVWHTELIAGDTVSIDFVSDAANAFYNGGGNAYSAFGGQLIG